MQIGDNNGKTSTDESSRIKQYKNLNKHEDMRRRRTECSVEIRKQKGDDMLMKRRNLQVEENDDEASEASDVEVKPATQVPRMTNDEVIAVLTNNPTMEQMRDCFESVRRSLSKSKNPPVDDVIKCGLLAALVQALSVEDEKVRFEAAWALTNVVSGTSSQTVAAVEAGATAPLVALTMSPSMSLSEQALWAVANIAGDSAQLRDHVTECRGVEALVQLVQNLDKLEVSFARTLAWAYSNMCRHKNPHAPMPVLSVLSTGLTKLVSHPDKQVRQDACWAVSYLTDGPDEQIALAKSSGVLPYIIQFLRENDAMVAPALRVLGNMATGCDELTQTVVDLGTLSEIVPLAERARSSTVVKECCWLVSNVIAGTQSQIQAVIDARIMPLVIEVLRSGDYKCQFEASWAVANLAQGGTSNQIMTLVDDGAVPVLCALLTQTNVDMLNNALETIYALLTTVTSVFSDRFDEVRDSFEDCNGLDNLERLQESESEKIYALSYRIINEFFNDEDDGAAAENVVDENMQYNF